MTVWIHDDKGASVIVVHTEKGQAVLNEIRAGMSCQRAEREEDWPITADVRESVAMHPKKSQFWADLQAGKSFDELHHYVRKRFVHKVLSYCKMVLHILST